MTKSNIPLPCPFCGEETTVEKCSYKGDEFYILLTEHDYECNLRHTVCSGKDKDHMVNMWNTRHTDKRIEELENILKAQHLCDTSQVGSVYRERVRICVMEALKGQNNDH